MKKSILILVIAGFLVIGLSEVQAQTTQSKLNQVELLKQFIGNWKVDMAKDTILYWDAKAFGTGFEGNIRVVTKGKIVMEGKELWGFNKNGECIGIQVIKGIDMVIYGLWFTSKNKYVYLPYNDISNPEKASLKREGEFKSPDMIIENKILNNKIVKTTTNWGECPELPVPEFVDHCAIQLESQFVPPNPNWIRRLSSHQNSSLFDHCRP